MEYATLKEVKFRLKMLKFLGFKRKDRSFQFDFGGASTEFGQVNLFIKRSLVLENIVDSAYWQGFRNCTFNAHQNLFKEELYRKIRNSFRYINQMHFIKEYPRHNLPTHYWDGESFQEEFEKAKIFTNADDMVEDIDKLGLLEEVQAV